MVFLTAVRFAKKAKSKYVLVIVESTVSGHPKWRTRERLGDKLEFIAYDPFIRHRVLYRETKRVRSL